MPATFERGCVRLATPHPTPERVWRCDIDGNANATPVRTGGEGANVSAERSEDVRSIRRRRWRSRSRSGRSGRSVSDERRRVGGRVTTRRAEGYSTRVVGRPEACGGEPHRPWDTGGERRE